MAEALSVEKTGKSKKEKALVIVESPAKSKTIKKILGDYKIKPTIDTKTLRELAGGHMNDTCKVAVGIYSILSENLKRT